MQGVGDLRHLRHIKSHRLQLAGMGKHLAGSPLQIDIAAAEHDNALGIAGDLLHTVADQHHRAAALRVVRAQQRQNILAAARVKSGCWFVQNQHLRLHGHHAGDGHAALLPAGQGKG